MLGTKMIKNCPKKAFEQKVKLRKFYFRTIKVVIDVDTVTSRQMVLQQIQKQAQGRIILAQGMTTAVI